MVLQKFWVSQNFSRVLVTGLAISFFSGYVRLAVSIFVRSCLGVSIFCKGKGHEVSADSFVYLIIDVFSSLDIEFQWSNLEISEKKFILTSPELSEFQEKLYKT